MPSREEYYDSLKARARELRLSHYLVMPRVTLTQMYRVLKDEGVEVIPWPTSRNLPGDPQLRAIAGAYIDQPPGPAIMLNRYQGRERRIFTLAHEFKHHIADRGETLRPCGWTEGTDPVEVGAGIFAAEFIFPEADFVSWMERLAIGKSGCTADLLLVLKHETRTTLSLTSLAKRAEWLGYAGPRTLQAVRWDVATVRELIGSVQYRRLRAAVPPADAKRTA